MAIVFYNTLSRKKESFEPIQKGIVKIYTCGPTVYDHAHIGNFRAFVFYDLLHRYLEWKGFEVRHVMNITDVDDKTIKGSRKKGISLKEYTEYYTKVFFEDMKTLNISKFDMYPKATEHIDDMVKLINILLKKGYAYLAPDGSIYYSVSKFKEYGKLSGIKVSKLKSGARVNQDEYEKKYACDFALWKAYTNEDGDVFWEPEFEINGRRERIKGRPGWHIECSTMAMKYLGETIDIHAGGVDLIFPHHENEIAQSEAATGKEFSRFWLHNEHVLVNGRKMSKSLGNFFTLRDLINQGYKPLAIRFALISAHYRSKLNISKEALKHASKAIERIEEFLKILELSENEHCCDIDKIIEHTRNRFEKAMDDDLNTPIAIQVIFEFINRINKLIADGYISREDAEKCKNLIMEFNKVLGIIREQKIDKEIINGLKEVCSKLEKECWNVLRVICLKN